MVPLFLEIYRERNVKFASDTYEEPPEEHPVRSKYSVHVHY